MVAAAKLRRAQEAVQNARPYAEKLGELLASVSEGVDGSAHPLLAQGSTTKPPYVVVISSDRGLCGGYNANLIKEAQKFLDSDEASDARLICCGRRGNDYFGKRIGERIETAHVNRPGGFDLAMAREVTEQVRAAFLSGEAGAVYLVYSRFRSAISQTPVVEKILPIAQTQDPTGEQTIGEEPALSPDYLFEPDPMTLLGSLLDRYLETKVFQALLEATASEHGARMSAMDSATRNASEMIDRLTLEMNRARQAKITTELMEIVGGAEALNG